MIEMIPKNAGRGYRKPEPKPILIIDFTDPKGLTKRDREFITTCEEFAAQKKQRVAKHLADLIAKVEQRPVRADIVKKKLKILANLTDSYNKYVSLGWIQAALYQGVIVRLADGTTYSPNRPRVALYAK